MINTRTLRAARWATAIGAWPRSPGHSTVERRAWRERFGVRADAVSTTCLSPHGICAVAPLAVPGVVLVARTPVCWRPSGSGSAARSRSCASAASLRWWYSTSFGHLRSPTGSSPRRVWRRGGWGGALLGGGRCDPARARGHGARGDTGRRAGGSAVPSFGSRARQASRSSSNLLRCIPQICSAGDPKNAIQRSGATARPA